MQLSVRKQINVLLCTAVFSNNNEFQRLTNEMNVHNVDEIVREPNVSQNNNDNKMPTDIQRSAGTMNHPI